MVVLLIFNLVFIGLIIADVCLYKKTITPFSVIAIVYVGLIDVNNLIAVKWFYMRPVYAWTMIVLSLFLIIVFAIDVVVGIVYRAASDKKCTKDVYIGDRALIYILFFVGVIAYVIAYVQCLVSFGFGNTKGNLGGVFAHIASFGFLLGPVAFDHALKSKNKTHVFFVLLFSTTELVVGLLCGGKYVVFINAVYYLLYFLLKPNRKIEVKKLLQVIGVLCASVILVFGIVYYVVPKLNGIQDVDIIDVGNKISYYLLSPITANNYTLNHPRQTDQRIPFSVVINLYDAVAKKGLSVSPIYKSLFEACYGIMARPTNVSGLFGELTYNLGYIGALLYSFVYFVIISVFGLLQRTRQIMHISYSYLMSITLFMFFGNFFTVSGVVLPLLLAMVIDICLYVRRMIAEEGDIKLSEEMIRSKNIRRRVVDTLKLWPVILLCGCVVAGLIFIASGRSDHKVESVATEELVLSEIDMNDINNIYTYMKQIEEYQSYQNSSMLMKIDPFNEKLRILQFNVEMVSTDENASNIDLIMANSSNITKIFSQYLQGGDFKQAIIDNAGVTIYEQDFPSVIFVTLYDSSATIEVGVVYSDDMNIDAVTDVVKEYMSGNKASYSSDYILTYEKTRDTVRYDQAVATAQTTITNSINSVQATIDNIIKSFTEKQKLYCMLYTDIPVDYDGVMAQDASTSSGVSKILIIAGFIMGVMLSFICIFVYYVLSPVLIADDLISSWFDITLFGSIYKAKGSRKDVDKEIGEIAQKIAIMCRKEGINSVAITGELADGKKQLKTLTNQLKELDIEVAIADDMISDAASLDRCSKAGSIVLMERMKKTRNKDIDRTLNMAKEYGIKVMGAIVY